MARRIALEPRCAEMANATDPTLKLLLDFVRQSTTPSR